MPSSVAGIAGEKLSVAIIARNEEERLPACLESVRFADEIVVVDSGSTDGTVAVAESYGARVFREPWRGFSGQKQYAVDMCTHDWVLILDADERVPRETAAEIREILNTPPTAAAFGFRRKNFLHDRWIRHCGWWPDRIVRLVHRGKGRFDGRAVHESWITNGVGLELASVIEHFSFRNYSELVAKMELYSTLAAGALRESGRKIGPAVPAFHGLWMFLRTYVLELGFLDGFDGFVISVMNGGGSFLKYAKAREPVCAAPRTASGRPASGAGS